MVNSTNNKEPAEPNVPDRGLLPPKWEPEESESEWKKRLKRTGQVATGVALLLGMLHLSGFYQLSFFQRTPPEQSQPPVNTQLDAEVLTLPARVLLVQGPAEQSTKRTAAQARDLIADASRIWDQAAIDLRLTGVEKLNLTKQQLYTLNRHPHELLPEIKKLKEGSINILLVPHLRGINGISYGHKNTVAVADFTSVPDFRVLAHEVGHVLSLGHVNTPQTRLMYQGARGFNLTLQEATTARQRAEVLFPSK